MIPLFRSQGFFWLTGLFPLIHRAVTKLLLLSSLLLELRLPLQVERCEDLLDSVLQHLPFRPCPLSDRKLLVLLLSVAQPLHLICAPKRHTANSDHLLDHRQLPMELKEEGLTLVATSQNMSLYILDLVGKFPYHVCLVSM